MEPAQCSGYRGATLISLGQCSNFKRTHQFIFQLWEALYREMLHAYLLKSKNMKIFDEVKCLMTAAIEQKHSPLQNIERIEALL